MSAKRRTDNIQPLGEALGEWARRLRLESGLHEAALLSLWEEHAGRELHRATRKLELRNGVLYASMTDGTARHELLMIRSRVLAEINKALTPEQQIREIRAF
ncbi:DUF721 domain-containing protein [bacterium]|nr:DUF721 domain-containing protein [bacterium]